MELFYKLSIETIDTILETGLPKSTQNLLWYLCKLNPFGDRPVQITWEKAKEAIGISKATFYRALAQLKETGLLICGSLRGFSVSLKNETSFSKVSEESQECVSQSQKWDSTIYTDLNTFSYSPDGQSEEKCKIPDPESNTNDRENRQKLTTANISQNSLVKPISQGEEKYSAAGRTKKRTEKFKFDWLPEGPWNIEGKLDPNFRDWLAKNWLKRYGGDFHDKQADVLAHFRKDPANLPIRWEQYQKEFVHRVENTQMRLANGCQINEATQQTIITHQRAVTAVLPPEMNPVRVSDVSYQLSAEEVLSLTHSKNSEEAGPAAIDDCSLVIEHCPTLDESADNKNETPSKNSETESVLTETCSLKPDTSPEYSTLPDGTRLKVFQSQQEPESVAPEQANAFTEMVQGFLNGFAGKRGVCPKPKTELEELNEMLLEPVLREEAIEKARRSPDYRYCPDLDQIIAAEEF